MLLVLIFSWWTRIRDHVRQDADVVREWMREKCPNVHLIWVNEEGKLPTADREFVVKRRKLGSMLLQVMDKISGESRQRPSGSSKDKKTSPANELTALKDKAAQFL